jgi:hypothetical protein
VRVKSFALFICKTKLPEVSPVIVPPTVKLVGAVVPVPLPVVVPVPVPDPVPTPVPRANALKIELVQIFPNGTLS